MNDNSHTTRQQPGRLILGSLEIGRFIAASTVVLTHFIPHIQVFARANALFLWGAKIPGAIGVQYFFVLSGFVMLTAHRKDFGDVRAPLKFWWRRACRIYPIYWISLGVMTIYLYGLLTPELAIKLFFLTPANVADWVPPAWSLHYEIAFYLIFGLCLLPYIGRPLLAAWIISVLWVWSPAFITNVLPAAPLNFLRTLVLGYGQEFYAPFELYFFAGLLGGWIFLTFQFGRGASIVLLTAGLAILFAAAPHMNWGFGYGPPLISLISGLGFACVVVSLGNLERTGALSFGVTATRLGAMSYPLYILHGTLLFLFQKYCGNWFRLDSFGLGVLAICGLAVLYGLIAIITFGIDQPLQRILRRQFRGKNTGRPGQSNQERLNGGTKAETY